MYLKWNRHKRKTHGDLYNWYETRQRKTQEQSKQKQKQKKEEEEEINEMTNIGFLNVYVYRFDLFCLN